MKKTTLLLALILIIPMAPLFGSEEKKPDEKKEEAGELDEFQLPEVVVKKQRTLTSASDRTFRASDFTLLPRRNPSEILEVMPGIHISQHTGGAKAHQIFLRGFDCEHGQDFAGYFDGIPLNQLSQVHGEGYLDLHFLIPETVEEVRVIKGPYDAAYGNYAVAGAMNIIPRYSLEENFLKMEYGSFATGRVLAAGAVGNHLFALEADGTNGFTDPGEAEGARFFTSHKIDLTSGSTLKLLGGWFFSEYEAADVVPVELVEDGTIDRYDGMDETDGGDTLFNLFGMKYEIRGNKRKFSALYYTRFAKTDLYSNYTYYLFDPVRGDQMRFFDRRVTSGLKLKEIRGYELGRFKCEGTFGLDIRLARVTQKQAMAEDREIFDVISDYNFWQDYGGIYFKQDMKIAPSVRLVPGLRYDCAYYEIHGTQDYEYLDLATNKVIEVEDAERSRYEFMDILSPKCSLIWLAREKPKDDFSRAEFFLNYGEGFTTPKANLVANDNLREIPVSRGGEVSARLNFLGDSLSLSPGYWVAHKETEMVFEPESGVSNPRGSSLRYGFEMEARWRPSEKYYFSVDYFRTVAKFEESEHWIPGTPRETLEVGASYGKKEGLKAMVKTRFTGSRPLAPGVNSRPFIVTDFSLAYRKGAFEAGIAVENLFNRQWDDTSFYYESRPEPSAPAEEGLHITPGTPIKISFMVSYFF